MAFRLSTSGYTPLRTSCKKISSYERFFAIDTSGAATKCAKEVNVTTGFDRRWEDGRMDLQSLNTSASR